MSVLDRIAAKCVREDRGYATPCRIFKGSLNDGYGQIWDASVGRMRRVHRVAYLHLVGPVPDGLVLDHLCGQKDCCEHAHLEAVTQRENLYRSPNAHAFKTHCIRGHELTEDNVYLDQPFNGTRARHCKTCKREWQQRRPPRRRLTT